MLKDGRREEMPADFDDFGIEQAAVRSVDIANHGQEQGRQVAG